ncbi:MAG: glycosyltransferase family 2 protein [Phycisphaeraceae bacterium]
MPPPITFCILAHNEARRIADAIGSARACPWCSQILVFDSGSTDDTVALATSLADRVEHHPWIDFTTNRRRIVEAADHDWVFILDADEIVSDALRDEIAALPDAAFTQNSIFTMPRKNFLLGRHVRAWDPDRIDRLFDRRRVTWPHASVHDRRTPTSGVAGGLVAALRHAILHKPRDNDWSDYFDGPRYAARTDALALEMFNRGKRVSTLGLLLRPPLTVFKYFILKRGFLQGGFGLLVAQKAAVSVQLKYARLWHLQQAKGTEGRRDEGTKGGRK